MRAPLYAAAAAAVVAARRASVRSAGTFGAALRLCDANGANCHDRWWTLPASGTEWAATCDTLGDIYSSFNSGVPVQHFWYWVREGSQDGAQVEVSMYEGDYCGGKPIEWDTSYQGRFQATMNPDQGASGWSYKQLHTVRSIRATAVANYNKGADQIGVKLVVFPLYNMDQQLGTMDEFTCEGNGYHDVGLKSDAAHKWPSACASPIDRVYCIDRTPGDTNWGAVDDWPTYGFDFAGNWDIPKAFNGTFPMGSAWVDTYTSSWTSHAPCTDPASHDPFDPLPPGACVVTKLYEEPCTTAARSIAQWSTSRPQYVLRQLGACVNSGGGGSGACSDPPAGSHAGGAWPQPIRCAWTRVVSGTDCA